MSARRWPVGVLVLVALVASGLYLAHERGASPGGPAFPLDDSWIHLQFARSLADGSGLAYRPGRWVAGSTAPLWTALVSVLFAVPGPGLAWVKLAGVVLYAVAALLTYVLARELGCSPWAARLAGLLLVLTEAMVWSALSGMEVGLFVVLTLSGTILHLRERRRPVSRRPLTRRPSLALPVLGLASLARPEGLLLLGLAVLDRLLFPPPGSPRREVLPGLAFGLVCAAALVGVYQLFALAASGSLLPTTFAVKTEGGASLLPSGRFLYRVLGILFRPHPLPVFLTGGGVLVLLAWLGTRRDRGLLPAMWVVGLPLAYSLLDSPASPMLVGNLGRYYFPLFPYVLVLAVLAMDSVYERLPGKAPALRKPAIALALVALLGPPAFSLWQGADRYASNVRDVNRSDVAMALWIDRNLPPEALVAAQDIGALGFFAPNPLIDLTGIVNPEILEWIEGEGGTPAGLEGLVRYLEARRPAYLVIFADSYPGLLERLPTRLLHRLRLAENRTMAGSDLRLVKLAWPPATGSGEVDDRDHGEAPQQDVEN